MTWRAMPTLDMTDEQLEDLATRPRIEYGLSPWAHFSTERTSFGRSIRRRAFYPSILPLMFNGDHYVDHQSGLRANELTILDSDASARTYISWNADKVELLSNVGMRALHIPHPWVTDQKLRKIFKNGQRSIGSLFFYPHSGPVFDIILDEEDLFNRLKKLPSSFHPIVLCLSSHDIRLGNHKRIRESGFPLTTAGDLNSQHFAERFYSLLNSVEYSISACFGTEMYYCLDAGKTHIILENFAVGGQTVDRHSGASRVFEINMEEYLDSEKFDAASQVIRSISRVEGSSSVSTTEFVKRYMGYSAESSRLRFAIFVWGQLVRNIPEVFNLYVEAIRKARRR
jgi:hypothetical protein